MLSIHEKDEFLKVIKRNVEAGEYEIVYNCECMNIIYRTTDPV